MKTKLFFHFRGYLANLISGMRTIQSLGKHRTHASFRDLALSPVAFGSQFDFFWGGGEFVGHLIFLWIQEKISTKLSRKRKFSTTSLNQCQGHGLHQFHKETFFLFCVQVWSALNERFSFATFCQKCARCINWSSLKVKLNKDYGPLRVVLGGTGGTESILMGWLLLELQ